MTKNEKLKQSRLKKGLTQAELADILKVKQAYISGIETTQTFGIKKAREIAKVLDVDAEWLYNDDIKQGENTVPQKENHPIINQQANENTTNSYKNEQLGFSDNERPNFYQSLPLKSSVYNKASENMLRWIDPNHTPIPVYDLTEKFDSVSELIENGRPSVILLKGHLKCDAVIRHTDSAMNKDWPVRCQLGIRRINNFKTRVIWGTPHRIVLEETIVSRYVLPHDNENKLLLRSSDPDRYPDMIVDKDEVKEMWKIESVTPIPDIILF